MKRSEAQYFDVDLLPILYLITWPLLVEQRSVGESG
jgi:hypothetical protein